MCGINGFNFKDEKAIQKMNSATSHRGPDDTGVFSDENVTLGHNRLSIIDLSQNAHQPMFNDKGDIGLVFNGEIYNFSELRENLKKDDMIFFSKSDTEVVLKGYEKYGVAFFKKLRGMWALAVYDIRKKKLILSRDPFGIKPLHYYDKEGVFAFSSELKGLVSCPKIKTGFDEYALGLFFVFGFAPAPLSTFENIQKLLPGEVIVYNLNHKKITEKIFVKPYYEEGDIEKYKADPDGALKEILQDSIKAHFISDVPVGIFFSGGNDSSLILAMAREMGFDPTAFFMLVPNRLDEPYALSVAKHLGVKLETIEIKEDNAVDIMDDVLEMLDEPFADSSILPTAYLCKNVAKTHKVVLSGEGGDEFFGGYHRHRHFMGLPMQKSLSLFPAGAFSCRKSAFCHKYLNEHFLRIRRGINAKVNRDLLKTYLEFVRIDQGVLKTNDALSWLKKSLSKADIFDNPAFFLDEITYLPNDLLSKIDTAGMFYSLEARVPFLDKKIFSFVRTLDPVQRRGKSRQGKDMLRKVLYDYLPQSLIERPKQGFSFPLSVLKNNVTEQFQPVADYAYERRAVLPFSEPFLTKLAKKRDFQEVIIKKHITLCFALLVWYHWENKYRSIIK